MAPKTVFVTGANGYIGNAVARAFVAAGWKTYGLVRSPSAATALAQEEIIPIVGAIDDLSAHAEIQAHLPATLHAIVSATENPLDYMPHYNNTIKLLRTLGAASSAAGTRPIVIFSSGCKDYGIGPHYHGASDLAPHTEDSPINTVPFLINRATHARKIFDHSDVFAPVLVRPTNVYGRSSSFYKAFFDVAAKAAADGKPLLLPTPPNTIVHALHVDDCGEAYVAIASHVNRSEAEGQVFNISAQKYETVDEVAKALVKEYNITGGLKYVDPLELKDDENPWPNGIINFPQWTDSTKLTNLTGWKHHRPLFSEGLHVYRVAFEAAKASGHEGVKRTKAKTHIATTARHAQDGDSHPEVLRKLLENKSVVFESFTDRDLLPSALSVLRLREIHQQSTELPSFKDLVISAFKSKAAAKESTPGLVWPTDKASALALLELMDEVECIVTAMQNNRYRDDTFWLETPWLLEHLEHPKEPERLDFILYDERTTRLLQHDSFWGKKDEHSMFVQKKLVLLFEIYVLCFCHGREFPDNTSDQTPFQILSMEPRTYQRKLTFVPSISASM
ncbi:hypothetical protein CGLO_08575 [Colletotrichum gloeosporioides Cg-14]|uniref:NAD-dependent epimerase/dehydratase domain-containing protein n=1 Tax=Colletotrichum gloeosporioides (strain Cg-14) TaxID=1237896 RepID=T0LJK8_COLGC|nr:hypothetical protein CGLO_08575 [Colletotrichum gloeosporioides Cg-14]